MSSTLNLHPNTLALYRWIVRFKRMNAGDSPTRREIAAGVGLTSIAMVQYHLVRLEAAGLIERPAKGKARRIGIPGATWHFDEVGGESNKCALSVAPAGEARPEEERKVRERLGVLGEAGGL